MDSSALKNAYRDDPELSQWLLKVGHMLSSALAEGISRDAPVVRFASPEELYAHFSDSVGLGLRPEEEAHNPEQVLVAVNTILERAVHSAHPRFFNQNWAGADPISVIGDWLTAFLNTTAATYEMAPVFTLMENEILARMSSLAGLSTWEDAPHTTAGAHGLFTPGGATSNLWAMHLARMAQLDNAAEEGLYGAGPRLVAFTSDHSHYSLEKAAVMLGLGRKSLVKVPCDEAGQMKVDELRRAILEVRDRGEQPFFVNATAGTTVTGAFDDIQAIANLTESEGLWLHVDGCYGGTVLFSETYRRLMNGCQRAQSLSWNPHKMMGMTQQCSVLLLKDKAALREAFAVRANYIFQSDKNYSEMDLGDLTLMCGRRSDGLKLWLTWKMRGDAWFKARIEHAVDLAEQLEHMVMEHPAFILAHSRTFANIGFWWVPPDLRPLDSADVHGTIAERLHRLAPKIKDRMQRDGDVLLGYQPLPGRPNFFRLLVMNPDVTREDLQSAMNIIDRLGQELESVHSPSAVNSSW